MLDQREAPIPAAPAEDIAKKPQSHIAAFNVGGLNLAPASNDETFELDADDPGTPDLFNEGGAGNKSADRKATEFTNEMGMSADVKLGNGGGSLSQLSLREIEERKRERAAEAIEAFLERAAEHDREVKAAQAKWDAEMHDYGGEKLSGAEIMRRIEWFEKKENQDKVRDQLRKQGKTEQEIEETIRKMKERDELMKRQRNGEKLSPQDQLRLDTLNKDNRVVNAGAIISTESKKDIAKEAAWEKAASKLDQGRQSAVTTLDELQSQAASGRGLTADERRTLEDLQKDSQVVAANKLFEELENGAAKAKPANTPAKGYEDFPSARDVRAEFNVGGLAQETVSPVAGADLGRKPEPDKVPAEEPKVKIAAAKVEASVAAFM